MAKKTRREADIAEAAVAVERIEPPHQVPLDPPDGMVRMVAPPGLAQAGTERLVYVARDGTVDVDPEDVASLRNLGFTFAEK